MSAILLSILSYLGGDLVGLILARLGLAGFAPKVAAAAAAASPKVAQAAGSAAKAALERILTRAADGLTADEAEQQRRDAAAVKDWFPQ